ncbi:MAG TPA: hypothetical protein VD963_04725 [Phycisphaerales bacterium]|nr:hypothetical protein [Phycisphaerales bacterium]
MAHRPADVDLPLPSGPRAVLAGLLGAVLLSGAAGCNIIGPAAYFAMGPEKVPAQYQLDEHKPVVVFVDDRASRVPDRVVRRRIGQAADEHLVARKLAKDVIAADSVAAVVAREKFGRPMGIADVGRAVSAGQVVYVRIEEFTLSADGTAFAPRAVADVKVVDVETGTRLWPDGDPGYHQLVVELPPRQGTAPRTTAELIEAQRVLAQRLGTAIGQLFYEHEQRPTKDRLSD